MTKVGVETRYLSVEVIPKTTPGLESEVLLSRRFTGDVEERAGQAFHGPQRLVEEVTEGVSVMEHRRTYRRYRWVRTQVLGEFGFCPLRTALLDQL